MNENCPVQLPPFFRGAEFDVRAAALPYHLADQEMPRHWEHTGAGDGILVGVADTGIDPDHPEIVDKIVAAKSFVGGSVRDGNDHGCLHPENLIYTSFCGLEEIKTLYRRVPAKANRTVDCEIKEVRDFQIDTLSIDENGNTVRGRVTHLHRIPVKGQIVRLRLVNGTVLRLTPWHPCYLHKKVAAKHVIYKVRADEVEPGQAFATVRDNNGVRGTNIQLKVDGTDIELDESLAYMLGLFNSDGSVTYQNGKVNSVRFSNCEAALCDRFERIAACKFSGSVRRRECKTSLESLAFGPICRVVEAMGLGSRKENRPILPELLAKSPLPVIQAYLAGFIDGDGNINDGRIRVITSRRDQADRLAVMLRHLGVSSGVSVCKAHDKFPESYHVRIPALPGIVKHCYKCEGRELAPPKMRRRELVVESARENYDGDFYDFTVEGHHNYVSEGAFISNTHVATTIAGVNVGVAPEAKLAIAKVLGDNGSGSNRGVAEGIDWLVEHDVDIINLSLGGPYDDPLTRDAVQRARAAGVLVFAATGNERASHVGYPAVHCIGCGAVDRDLRLAYFSNRGKHVDLVGYGVNIYAGIPGGRYAEFSGTSMATPYLAGIAANRLSAEQIHSGRITTTSDQELLRLETIPGITIDLGPAGRDTSYGRGFPSLDVAFYQGLELPPGETPAPPNNPIDGEPIEVRLRGMESGRTYTPVAAVPE